MSCKLDEVGRLVRASTGALAIAYFIGAGPAAAGVGQSDQSIVVLAFDPVTHSLIKASPNALYRSVNDGRDWQVLPLGSTAKRSRIAAVAVAPDAVRTIYVAGSKLGVLRSSDEGQTWVARNEGLPSRDVVALTVHADQPATVYAYIAGKGIYRSEDSGDHWRLMGAGPREGMLQFVHSNMPESMQTGWLFAATAKGVARSMDCFCGWRDAGALGRPASAVVYDHREPKRVFAATAEGLFVSETGGERWSPLHSPGPATALVATANGLLIAVGDPSTLFRSTDHGVTWRRIDG